MNSSLRPGASTRDSQKCSACRHRKKKCIPHDRDWQNSQQKCDFCKDHNKPCGPNLRYSEDPATPQRPAPVLENASVLGSNQVREPQLEGSTAFQASNIPTPPRRTRQTIESPPNASRREDGTASSHTASVNDLEQEASSKLHDFHALAKTLAYISKPAFVYCHAHEAQPSYHDLTIEEKLHDLFISIHGIAVHAKALDEACVARWILFALLVALEQHPQVVDKRKRHILLKMALLFQELGHHWEFESILLKIAGMYQIQTFSHQGEPSSLLADSFPISSNSINRVLVGRWNETVGDGHVDLNLNVPPLHAAVQHRNPCIILALLLDPRENCSAAVASSLTTFSNAGQEKLNIEERDINNCTALFKAVSDGNEACCRALLLCEADPNTRDGYGHTALEVAAKGGHTNIVRLLVEYKADVNPNITRCSSLPLHAAIESGNFQLDIIQHLLNAGAAVDLRRFVDNKHAIDLAVHRGHHTLADTMRRMIPSFNNTPFMFRDPSMG